MGRKKSKKIKQHFILLLDEDEIKSAIKERHLAPVRIVDANGFITIADMEDYYERSYAQKDRYEQITWDEFFKELEKRKLFVVKDVNSGFVKLVKQNTVNRLSRYFIS